MPDPKQLSPLLDGLVFGAEVYSEGTKSLHLLRDPKNGTVFLLRIFTIPENQRQLDALVFSGAVTDRAEALRYYTDQLIELRRELETIKHLGEYDGIQAQIGYQIEELPDESGFEVYVLSNYLPTLNQHLSLNHITKLEALNLSLDLCDALFTIHENGQLVKNISPDNILITPNNRFVLANLSLAELDRLDYHSIAASELSAYSAPELYGIVPSFQPNSDLYSLGMVLYYIFNGSHNAFVDERTTQAAATKRRLDGEELPVPLFADYELSEILLKACAFDPAERYQAADELKQALVLYMQRNPVSDEPILPPIISVPEDVVDLDAPEEDEPISFASADNLDEAFVAHLSPDLESSGSDSIDELLAQVDAPAEETTGFVKPTDRAKPPKKGRVIIPLVCILALIAAAVALTLYLKRPTVVALSGLQAVESDFGTVTVTLDQPETDAALNIVCADAYGNAQRKEYTGQAVTFDDLLPGAQYSFSVETDANVKFSGTSSVNLSTTPMATLNGITVSNLTTSTVTLQLNASGAVPEAWTIRCSGEGMDEMTHTFTGSSIDITGLRSNTTYTCSFEDASGTPLNGETSVTFTTEPSLTLESFEVAASSATSVSLVWSYSGDFTAPWVVRCEGSSGDTREEELEGLSCTFSDLTPDIDYTFTITTAGMEPSDINTVQVSTVQPRILTLEATDRDSETLTLRWESIGFDDGMSYTVHYRISGFDEEETLTTTADSVILEQLLPDTSYTISLRDGDDQELVGECDLFARTGAAGSFSDYGTKNLYCALWVKPNQANWTVGSLKTSRSKFKKDEGIVIAIESTSGIKKWDATVDVLYMIRNADNRPVSFSRKTVAWNDLWSGNLLLDSAPDTPQEKGNYTIEVYINNGLMTTIRFEIE